MDVSPEVRPAVPEDSRAVWEIRYHPGINESVAVQNSRQVPWEEHDAWFQLTYFSSGAHNRCYVMVNRTAVQGYCRFDLQGQAYVVSIAVHPAAQGQGNGELLLTKSLAQLPPGTMVRAIINQANPASERLFVKNNFLFQGEEGANNIFTKIT